MGTALFLIFIGIPTALTIYVRCSLVTLDVRAKMAQVEMARKQGIDV